LDVARGLCNHNDPVLGVLGDRDRVAGDRHPDAMLAVAARAATFTYHSDKLATTGIFGIAIIVF